MNAQHLDGILQYDAEHHGGDKARRPYIDLSHIAECPAVLYQRYMATAETRPPVSHAMTQYSYELEQLLCKRLQRCGVYQPGTAITLSDGLVQGRTDGWIDHCLLEIATVLLPEYFPVERIPRRKYQQIQAYLHYTKSIKALALYFARSDGTWKVYDVPYNLKVAQHLAQKVEWLVAAVQAGTPSRCTCEAGTHAT